MERQRYGVLMVDVSKDAEERKNDILDALNVITGVYPDMAGHIFSDWQERTGKYGRIAEVIKAFDYCDILFCNTCGDEIDHLYRFVRAIAKDAGIEIVPVSKLRTGKDT